MANTLIVRGSLDADPSYLAAWKGACNAPNLAPPGDFKAMLKSREILLDAGVQNLDEKVANAHGLDKQSSLNTDCDMIPVALKGSRSRSCCHRATRFD